MCRLMVARAKLSAEAMSFGVKDASSGVVDTAPVESTEEGMGGT